MDGLCDMSTQRLKHFRYCSYRKFRKSRHVAGNPTDAVQIFHTTSYPFELSDFTSKELKLQ